MYLQLELINSKMTLNECCYMHVELYYIHSFIYSGYLYSALQETYSEALLTMLHKLYFAECFHISIILQHLQPNTSNILKYLSIV